jgi:hypothetical protein
VGNNLFVPLADLLNRGQQKPDKHRNDPCIKNNDVRHDSVPPVFVFPACRYDEWTPAIETFAGIA